MTNCLICKNSIKPFMSFGRMPIANGFLTKEQFKDEYFFDMKTAVCSKCNMFQLLMQPDREQMFNENYAFFSATSELMGLHFKQFANHVMVDYLKNVKGPFVVEIGSNDGILLKHFVRENIRHLGIEPSANVAHIASKNGINTIVEFFDENIAKEIVEEYGQADVFIGANVMCHITYIHSIVAGIKILLKPEGIVMFEDPYLGDMLPKTSYDQIYDEHSFMFSVHSIQYLFNLYDMDVIDIEPQDTHGGTMRYVIANKGVMPVTDNVFKQLKIEDKMGLTRAETYEKFRQNCEKSRDNLMNLLNDVRNRGKSIVGYAATSKSTTIMNYCGITTGHLEYISDTTPIKQGKYSPGVHIPVKSHEDFLNNYPDYTLLFAYNHSKEIMAKEQEYMRQGGGWITYVPEVKILNKINRN